MDDELRRRLDRLERRQRYTLLLVGYPYLVVAGLAATGRVDPTALVTAVVPAFGLIAVAYLVALVRARTKSESGA